jgi:hypothetical protein
MAALWIVGPILEASVHGFGKGGPLYDAKCPHYDE